MFIWIRTNFSQANITIGPVSWTSEYLVLVSAENNHFWYWFRSCSTLVKLDKCITMSSQTIWTLGQDNSWMIFAKTFQDQFQQKECNLKTGPTICKKKKKSVWWLTEIRHLLHSVSYSLLYICVTSVCPRCIIIYLMSVLS